MKRKLIGLGLLAFIVFSLSSLSFGNSEIVKSPPNKTTLSLNDTMVEISEGQIKICMTNTNTCLKNKLKPNTLNKVIIKKVSFDLTKVCINNKCYNIENKEIENIDKIYEKDKMLINVIRGGFLLIIVFLLFGFLKGEFEEPILSYLVLSMAILLFIAGMLITNPLEVKIEKPTFSCSAILKTNYKYPMIINYQKGEKNICIDPYNKKIWNEKSKENRND
jgi:hypothetical protein